MLGALNHSCVLIAPLRGVIVCTADAIACSIVAIACTIMLIVCSVVAIA
jgi:hypothetical protein